MASGTPASNAGGGIGDNAVINNLINNNGTTSRAPSSYNRPPRESSPLLGGEGDGRQRRRNRYLWLLAQLLGAAVLAAALIFGVLAFRKGGHESVPFPQVDHPLKPTAFWGAARAPYPTGAWWTNLVLGKGDQNVAVLPYTIRATNERGLEISYSDFRHLSSANVEADLFAPDFRLASVENATEHFVEGYDALSVSVAFKVASVESNVRRRQATYRTHLVRGSPYVTVEYDGATPVVEPPNMVTVVNGLQLKEKAEFEDPQLTESVFDLTAISGQRWLLFANPPITLLWSADGNLRALGPYHGYLRMAMGPTLEARQVLLDHWEAYPTGGEVLLDTQQENMVTYEWRKKGNGPLLMMALPHHMSLLQSADVVKELTGVYKCLKGPMTAIRGDRWFLKESVSKIRWTAPRPISPDKVSAVKEALKADLAAFQSSERADRWNLTDSSDPYWAGKQMGMLARLALIADELGMEDEKHQALKLTEQTLGPWLEGSTDNPFLYDRTWGGVVIKNGLSDPYVNFGNTYYNDHHFQYGYFAYAGGVIAKLDPGYLREGGRRAKLDAIVHDIANYDVSSRYFPLARHKDFYDGHSWASGLFVQNNGKSQESSSEAIHAYYGASLYGEATGDTRLEKFAALLMAMEIRSTKFYWHMRTNDSVYDEVFSANKMVGVVGALDVTCQTWFGTNFEFVHGINFMPFTPITEAYLDRAYVEEEYPVLSSVLGGEQQPDEGWRGFIYLDHAIIDKEAAWEEVKGLSKFDSGNSQANSLYWVATRPDPSPGAPAKAHAPAS